VSALHKLDLQPRLVVALETHSGLTRMQLRGVLSGPLSQQYSIGDVSRAQVLIADHDHESSRRALAEFLLAGRGPAIVIATVDPGLSGAVWVSKPVREEELLLAAQMVWNRIASPNQTAPVAALAQESERAPLRLLPSRPVSRPARAEASHHRLGGRPLVGTFGHRERKDWTASIFWMALGSMFIAALVSLLGWRPAAPAFRPVTPKAESKPLVEHPNQDLRQAIEQAIRAMPSRTPAQRASIDAEVAEITRLSGVLVGAVDRTLLSIGGPWPDVSQRALPVDLLADAQVLWHEQASVRAAFSRDVSVVAKRED
jgi:hypothetical protein